jgi:hypothetical protein
MRFARLGTLSISTDRPVRQSGALTAAHRSRSDRARGSAGSLFAAHRFHHTVELIGACVMMAAFLVIALFA